ncbi:MAG: SDR family oxidoreductase, partial [Nitrosopumilus sp.]
MLIWTFNYNIKNTVYSEMKALIVGGSSGMGKETAKLLLKRSVEVVLIASNIDKLQKAKKELEEFGTVSIEKIDLYDEDQVNEFAKKIRNDNEHINYLVNSAGKFSPKSFLEHNKQDYDKYLEINKSTFFITQAVAENMKKNGGGSIVN